jgi:hypothetical protein
MREAGIDRKLNSRKRYIETGREGGAKSKVVKLSLL